MREKSEIQQHSSLKFHIDVHKMSSKTIAELKKEEREGGSV
jgi:hypothetical protein